MESVGKNKRKRYQQKADSVISCSNRYEILSTEEDSDIEHENEHTMTHAETTTTKNTTQKIKKPTPIVIHGRIENHTKFMNTLKNTLSNKYHIKYHKDKTEVFTTSKEDYNKLKQEYQTNKIEFHTYTLHNERRKTFVIKGLHPVMEESEIQEDLIKQGLPDPSVHSMKGTNIPMYIVSLPATVKLSLLNHKIHYICNIKIKWEDYKTKRRAAQCHRCQEWGHATSNCYAEPACLKCAENHLTKDCTKPREQPAKCVNCEGNHPANATICEVYQQRIQWIARKSKPIPQKVSSPNSKLDSMLNDEAIFPNLRRQHKMNTIKNPWTEMQTPKITYAACTAGIKSTKATNISGDVSEMTELANEIQEIKKLCNVKGMLQAVKELRIQLIQCKSKIEQFEAFINFCDKLDD